MKSILAVVLMLTFAGTAHAGLCAEFFESNKRATIICEFYANIYIEDSIFSQPEFGRHAAQKEYISMAIFKLRAAGFKVNDHLGNGKAREQLQSNLQKLDSSAYFFKVFADATVNGVKAN